MELKVLPFRPESKIRAVFRQAWPSVNLLELHVQLTTGLASLAGPCSALTGWELGPGWGLYILFVSML